MKPMYFDQMKLTWPIQRNIKNKISHFSLTQRKHFIGAAVDVKLPAGGEYSFRVMPPLSGSAAEKMNVWWLGETIVKIPEWCANL